jgi:hypothetical protein
MALKLALSVKRTSLCSVSALSKQVRRGKSALKRKFTKLNTERRGELSTNYPSPTSLAEEGALSTIVLSGMLSA